MKLVDLSVPIANGLHCDPPLTAPHVIYQDHQKGAEEMQIAFEGLKPEHLPDGIGWATEKITLNTHSGTHMDAPWHYGPIMNRETEEKRALTIDEIPLDWCIGSLIVLDCTDLAEGYVLEPSDIDVKLNAMGHSLNYRDIVCVHTTAPKYFGTVEYRDHGVGVGKAGTLHLLRQGVRVVGTDAWSWDAPFSITGEKWKQSLRDKKPNTSIIWEGHFAGIERGYCQLEKLVNLDKVPRIGATIYCFPIKIAGASAGWVRAVASVPDT
ncbi:MAG: cyclase [Promethearchaeota archaeon CR_4]|nr:MAG: cyclase [Candidatus Lokiarchaeota archaeon CR_4]